MDHAKFCQLFNKYTALKTVEQPQQQHQAAATDDDPCTHDDVVRQLVVLGEQRERVAVQLPVGPAV